VTTIDLRSAVTSAPMSAALIAVNAAVFVAVNLESRLLEVLALPPTWAGVLEQPWTVVTVFFTAEAIVHLAVAVLVIGWIGTRFERAVGSDHLLGVYVAAGLAGSLALLATASAFGLDEPSVGASAAFLGLVGALAVSSRDAWGDRLPMGKFVVVVVVIQVIGPVAGIGGWDSSAAHLAGLATGAAYGYLLRARRDGDRDQLSASSREAR
jgi:membrane associated rhomboid family serine protease